MNFLLLTLASLSLALTQVLAGGRQPALCLPGYGLLAVAALLSWWPARRTAIPRATAECLATAVLFLAYIAARALWSPEEYLARNDLHMALGAAILYLLVALNVTSPRLRLLCVAGLLALALANCAVGAIQFFQGQNFMVFDFLPRADYGARASGFYGYPNHLATFLNVVLMLSLAVACWSRWPLWGKMIAGYVALVCLLGVLVTGSRGSYIAGSAGLLIFGALSLLRMRKIEVSRAAALLAAGGLALGLLGWGVQHLQAKSFLVQSRTTETLTVDTVRIRLWQAAWKQFRLQPVVGTGSGTYLYHGREFRSSAVQRDPVHAHNEYIELLAEYGVLGIAALVIFLETHLRRGWRALADSRASTTASNSAALTLGALSAASATLVHSFLDFSLHMPANALTAALVFGLLAQPGEPRDESAANEPGFPAWLRLVLPVLGLWMVIRAPSTWPAEYYAEQARRVITDWRIITTPEVAREAESLAQRGLARDPRHPELHFYIGTARSALALQAPDAAAKKELFAQSLAAYEQALALAPGDVRLVLCVGESLDALERFDEAAALYERARKLDPKANTTRLAHAAHLRLRGRFDEAAPLYRQAHDLGAGPAAKAGLELIEEARKSAGHPAPAPQKP